MESLEIEKKIARRKDILERLYKLLIEKFALTTELDEISEDTPLFGLGLGLDSIDALTLVFRVEQEFGVAITDENTDALRSVNTLVDFIIKKENENA